jgi:hypothetical protein
LKKTSNLCVSKKIIQGTYKPKVSLPKFYISCLQQTILSLLYSHNIEGGEFLWTAPSNIALVKYWGKGQSNSGKSISQFYLE